MCSDEEFKRLLKKGSLWHFRGKIETAQECQKHRQVVLHDVEDAWKFFFLSVATSQVEKKKQFIQTRKLPMETLVVVGVGASKYFKLETAFNGNSLIQYGVDQLYAEYSADPRIYKGKIEEEIFERILEAVRNSPLVSPVQKRMIWLSSES